MVYIAKYDDDANFDSPVICQVCGEPETEDKGKCCYYCEKCGEMVHGECIAHIDAVGMDMCKLCAAWDDTEQEWKEKAIK